MSLASEKHVSRGVVVAIAALAVFGFARIGSAAQALPRPANQPSPVLIYRYAPNPAHNQQGVSVWVFNDGAGGSMRIRAMASGGQSAASPPTAGAGVDTEPTWPAWISNYIPLNWKGWKHIDFAANQLTYRRPVTASAGAAPASFADSDTVGIDTTRRVGVFFISMMDWDGPDKRDATACTIDDFTASSASQWRLHGASDAQSAVVLKTGILPPHARVNHLSMKLSFAAAAQADSASMTYLGQLAALATQPCIVLVPKSPFNRQLPDATPAYNDASLRVEMFACPAQRQSAAFCLYALKPLTGVTAHPVGSLSIPGYSLPPGAVDIHVVKVVRQHGDGQYADWDATGLYPSLLVKDDRAPIESIGGALPVVRLTGDPVTDIAAHTQKQFWLTIEVPKDTPAGNYTQQIQISANQLHPFTITLQVVVLNLRLLSPSKQYAIAFRGKLGESPIPLAQQGGAGGLRTYTASGDPPLAQMSESGAGANSTPTDPQSAGGQPASAATNTQAAAATVSASSGSADGQGSQLDPGTVLAAETEYLSTAQFQAELADISRHGFRYVTLTDRGPAFWDAVTTYMNAPGLGYPFLCAGFAGERDAEAIDKERADRKLDPFYYLDENAATVSSDTAAFKAAGLQSAVIVPDDNSASESFDAADLAIHQADDPYVKRLLATGVRQANQRDWLAWNSASADPKVNRLYAGFLLFRSDMYGAFAMQYQNANGGDPFNDIAPRDAAHAGYRPQMATYPVQGGVIDTVQWEAAREGVNDVRYLTTFYAALRECKDSHVDKPLVPLYEARVKGLLAKPFWTMSDADLQATRYQIATYALRLRTDVDHFYAKAGGK